MARLASPSRTGSACTEAVNILSPITIKAYAEGAGLRGSAAILATAIALAESSGNQYAKNCDSNGTVDYGLWQINTGAHPQFNASRLLTDPQYNAQAMASVSNGGKNWIPWATYNENKYEAFLSSVPQRPGEIITKGGPGGVTKHEKEAIEGGIGAVVPHPNIPNPLSWEEAVAHVFEFLGSREGWIRIGKVLGGAVLLAIAIDELFKLNIGSTITGTAKEAVAPERRESRIVHHTVKPGEPTPRIPRGAKQSHIIHRSTRDVAKVAAIEPIK